uniref:Uncharacterized protein n=1 Tax=Vespula pensylvanica TaxID=30213 RepID=A0A834NZC6_VESPE|nr:hypothetical protein H0235_009731 [Vespula pensylvanica]
MRDRSTEARKGVNSSSGVHEQPTLVCLQDSNIKNSTVGGDKNGDNKKHTGRRATSVNADFRELFPIGNILFLSGS